MRPMPDTEPKYVVPASRNGLFRVLLLPGRCAFGYDFFCAKRVASDVVLKTRISANLATTSLAIG
jgi:hypothetical protein